LLKDILANPNKVLTNSQRKSLFILWKEINLWMMRIEDSFGSEQQELQIIWIWSIIKATIKIYLVKMLIIQILAFIK
jgi:hypothetical protein